MRDYNNKDDVVIQVNIGMEYVMAAIEREGGHASPELAGEIVKGVLGGMFRHIQNHVKEEVRKQTNRNN